MDCLKFKQIKPPIFQSAWNLSNCLKTAKSRSGSLGPMEQIYWILFHTGYLETGDVGEVGEVVEVTRSKTQIGPKALPLFHLLFYLWPFAQFGFLTGWPPLPPLPPLFTGTRNVIQGELPVKSRHGEIVLYLFSFTVSTKRNEAA